MTAHRRPPPASTGNGAPARPRPPADAGYRRPPRAELTVKPVVTDGARLVSLEGAAADAVVLPPYGVRVLRLETG